MPTFRLLGRLAEQAVWQSVSVTKPTGGAASVQRLAQRLG